MRSLALPPDGTAGIRLVLYFTKGLGDVVAAEVSAIVPSAAIQLAGDCFLVLAVTAAGAARLGRQARTVDDARLLVACRGGSPGWPTSLPCARQPPRGCGRSSRRTAGSCPVRGR